MPTHLYCLLPAGSSATPPESPPIRRVEMAGLVAWVADADAPRLSRDVRDAARATLEHDRVVNAALSQGITPVPAMLADPYASDEEAVRDIEAHAAQITAGLADVGDRVEMTVIVGVVDSPPPASVEGRGRAYLEQLRSLPSRAASAADRIEKSLQAFGGSRRRADGGRVGLSHLVSRSAVEQYREAALRQAAEGFRLVIDGPRAPYSFAAFSPRRGVSRTGSAA